jgi:hypothetical protein
MTRRATFREADLNRAVKVAEKHGWKVEIEGTKITLLPIDPDARLPSPDLTDSDFEARLAQWSRSA